MFSDDLISYTHWSVHHGLSYNDLNFLITQLHAINFDVPSWNHCAKFTFLFAGIIHIYIHTHVHTAGGPHSRYLENFSASVVTFLYVSLLDGRVMTNGRPTGEGTPALHFNLWADQSLR